MRCSCRIALIESSSEGQNFDDDDQSVLYDDNKNTDISKLLNGRESDEQEEEEDPRVREAKKHSMDTEALLKFLNDNNNKLNFENMVVPTTFPTTKTKDFSINTAINSCGFLFMFYYLLKKLNSLQSINSS